MYLTRWDALKFYILIGVFCGALTLSYIAIQSGVLPASSGGATLGTQVRFELEVSSNGETIYTGIESASSALAEELWEEVRGKVYPTPESAVEATSPVSGNPAYAHAVNICWNEDWAKISNETGSGRHRTWHRKDYNGFRYTTTSHDILTQYGYQSVALYKYRVALSYCN